MEESGGYGGGYGAAGDACWAVAGGAEAGRGGGVGAGKGGGGLANTKCGGWAGWGVCPWESACWCGCGCECDSASGVLPTTAPPLAECVSCAWQRANGGCWDSGE